MVAGELVAVPDDWTAWAVADIRGDLGRSGRSWLRCALSDLDGRLTPLDDFVRAQRPAGKAVITQF
jgi:hypothetical protein